MAETVRVARPLLMILLAALCAACAENGGGETGGDSGPAAPAFADVVRLGGDTTDLNASSSSFGFSVPAANLTPAHLALHVDGDARFDQSFVPFGEAGQQDSDGLGPVFNNSSCNACHQNDGRGTPPRTGKLTQNESVLLALSTEDGSACTPTLANQYCRPTAVPGFGRQMFHRGVLDARTDSTFTGLADVYVSYVTSTLAYADGSSVTLRRPVYELRNPYDNPGEVVSSGTAPVSRLLQPDVRSSPRIGMPIFGLGLVEAIREADILALADPDDRNGDGISGRANRVFDPAKAQAGDPNPVSLGRFGWKANNASTFDQGAAALVNDMGITNRLFAQESVAGTPLHDAYVARHPDDTGMDASGAPEASDEFLDAVIFYVSARRHRSRSRPAPSRPHPQGFTEFSNQTIYPFGDFLLHDMGDDLADGRSDFLANGREWRTRPLWGLGLTKTVNNLANFLHDGRARTVEEAVLWHGGEALASRDRFRALGAADRAAMVSFLNSL